MDSPLLTKEEAAEYLRLSPKSLARLSITRVKLGRLVRYHRSDLDTFLERSREAPLALQGGHRAQPKRLQVAPLSTRSSGPVDMSRFSLASSAAR